MANITVHCWNSAFTANQNPQYPADQVLKISSPGTVPILSTTSTVVITTSADTRMTFDGSSVTTGDMLVAAAAIGGNRFDIAAQAGGTVLTFL